ncbi:hypothetical protein HPP92_007679 [Vanilla planifolia]|uniref:AAA+ ATPase At3g28540-like C-terminal domain-containing protein n=1 Tax=Vanilla planifolia TaxID=51239 RepID=A0A835RKY4_VANPL|nr:hypothetical protein HPP92_007679 [Vanilla planifolia]
MEAKLKRTIMGDLDKFEKRKEHMRIERAWKHRYMLFGRPRIGKLGLITAMEDYFRFEIYDLDLKEDRLDQMLLQPRKMDMHIHMGYCVLSSSKVLASNYHSTDEHPLFEEIKGLLKEVNATPAKVANRLMSGKVEVALGGLIKLLLRKDNKGTKAAMKRRATRAKC